MSMGLEWFSRNIDINVIAFGNPCWPFFLLSCCCHFILDFFLFFWTGGTYALLSLIAMNNTPDTVCFLFFFFFFIVRFVRWNVIFIFAPSWLLRTLDVFQVKSNLLVALRYISMKSFWMPTIFFFITWARTFVDILFIVCIIFKTLMRRKGISSCNNNNKKAEKWRMSALTRLFGFRWANTKLIRCHFSPVYGFWMVLFCF